MPVRNASALTKTKVLSPNDAIDEGGLGIPVTEGDERVEFVVKYADNRAVLARQNLFSKVNYINEDESGRTITQRSFPMGDLRLETVMLVLTSWNLRPADGAAPFAITHKNVIDLMSAEELAWLYDRSIDMNPVWGGLGES